MEEELHPAVLRPLGLGGARRLEVALGDHLQQLRRRARILEEALDALTALLGEVDVVLLGPHRIRVGLEDDALALLGDARREGGERLLGLGRELVAVEREEHRLDAARSLAGLVGVAREHAHATVADLVHRTLIVGLALTRRIAATRGQVAGVGRAVEVFLAQVAAAGLARQPAGAIGALRTRGSDLAIALGTGRRGITAAEVDALPVAAVGRLADALRVVGAVLAIAVDARLAELGLAVLVFLAGGVRGLLARGRKRQGQQGRERGQGKA